VFSHPHEGTPTVPIGGCYLRHYYERRLSTRRSPRRLPPIQIAELLCGGSVPRAKRPSFVPSILGGDLAETFESALNGKAVQARSVLPVAL
jgi:hypothetical protein